MSDYKKHVKEALDRVYLKAGETAEEADIKDIKWIILSDMHRGQGDRADDFEKCKPVYHAALGYYLDAGYTLFLLGDVEDLWECFPRKVIRTYNDTLLLEKKFIDRDPKRYVRLFGNHDDRWCIPSNVKKYLSPYIVNDRVEEGRIFKFRLGTKERTLFFAHGHQGDLANDRISKLSRFVVRYIWRPIQVLTHIPSSTPATDFEARSQHEKAMYEWASAHKGLMLICGDTHHPVFASEVHRDSIQEDIERLNRKLTKTRDPRAKRSIREEIHYKHAELEMVLSKAEDRGSVWAREDVKTKPCYFNSGTCSFADGDITGIEIADGRIRLVRWPDDNDNPRRKVLREADLRKLLLKC